MTGNVELLNYIYQNSEMGKNTTKQLIGIVKDEEFKNHLESQFKEYQKIFEETKSTIKEMNEKVKGINSLSKYSTYIMIDIQTLRDKTPSHISEMMIQGSTMGIVDITKKLNEYKDVDKGILKLGNQLLKFEQRNIEELKKYLGFVQVK